ncbi:hypothetical protein CSHISOI_04956 [Colletotrichum shisoi]|uniref:Bet v1-like protein n=1 Tax=Colletotrichum shisoi TaxID=2078593 RepID=A0A5Q4BU04_9PEZI|nr:hypothetical protein CSHISOI_04956 [Colletotrichum shisoi]
MSSSTIPTSTSVVESAVIKAPLSHVWHFIKLQNFQNFWSALKGSEAVKAQEETDVVRWTFKDGTVLEVKQEEHSASFFLGSFPATTHRTAGGDQETTGERCTINHYITYSVITSQPELSYTSVVSTIRCYPVTSGESENSTFVEWTGNFSSDADAGVIQDAKFKRREALADLAKAAAKL